MNRSRYAFVVLALLSLSVGVFSLLFTVGVEHKFCGVVGAVTAVPVPRPADPKANPSRETTYEWYERFVTLGHSLGC